MPDRMTAGHFLDNLNFTHPSHKFTMKIEWEGSLPFFSKGITLTVHQGLRARCTSKEPTQVSFYIFRVTLTFSTSAA